MSEATKIEWCDSTFNPWIGCTKVGSGCDHCYAERQDARGIWGGTHWGTGAPRKRTSAENWRQPLRWEKQHQQFFEKHGRRRRVFCASLADVFDNEVPNSWRWDLFELIRKTPNVDWLILTKRIGNAARTINRPESPLCPINTRYNNLPNVWLGATVVNQEEADRDIPKLLQIPAAVRFLSIEPMLGPIDFRPCWLEDMTLCADCPSAEDGTEIDCPSAGPSIDWVIVGGESGPKARPMEADWVRSLRDQCAEVGTPFLFKQWGEFGPNWLNEVDGKIPGSEWMDRMGKKNAGRSLDGRTWDQFPEGSI